MRTFLILFILPLHIFCQAQSSPDTNCQFFSERKLPTSILNEIINSEYSYSYLSINHNLNFNRSTFIHDARFQHVRFFKKSNFNHVTFNKIANFEYSKFFKPANFLSTQFNSIVNFKGAEFISIADFDSAHFAQKAQFIGSKFLQKARFKYAYFDSTAIFLANQFNKIADFSSVKFKDKVDFNNAKFDSIAIFYGSCFNSLAKFQESKFTHKALFNYANFNAGAIFDYASFPSKANFVHTSFGSDANFDHASFGPDANFDHTSFSTKASFNHVKFNRATFIKSILPDTLYFNSCLINTKIDLLHSRLNKSKEVCYIDLRDTPIEKVFLRYNNFKLLIPDSIGETEYEEYIYIYESLLKKFKENHNIKSYEKVDKEYIEFKNTRDPALSNLSKFTKIISNCIRKHWNDFGYHKEYIWRWTIIILLFFFIINWLRFPHILVNGYPIPAIKEVFDKDYSRDKYPIINLRLFRTSFYFTCLIFFGLKLNIENLNFKNRGLVFYIFVQFISGMICLAYLADFVITIK